VSRVTVITRTF